MKKILPLAIIGLALVVGNTAATAANDTGIQKLTIAELDAVDAGKRRKKKRSRRPPPNMADATANAVALASGRNTRTYSATGTLADSNSGLSGSISSSRSVASGSSFGGLFPVLPF